MTGQNTQQPITEGCVTGIQSQTVRSALFGRDELSITPSMTCAQAFFSFSITFVEETLTIIQRYLDCSANLETYVKKC